MPTVLDIITDALKLGRVTASPTANEAADGLSCFQSMIDGFVTGGMFGRLEDVYLTENETALEGRRYFVPTGLTLTPATSIYEDESGATRQPRDLAIYETLTEAGARSVKLYDRTGWVELTDLTLSSEAPLALRNRLGLAAALATSAAFLAIFEDADVSPRVERLGRNFLGNISAKRGSTQPDRTAEYF